MSGGVGSTSDPAAGSGSAMSVTATTADDTANAATGATGAIAHSAKSHLLVAPPSAVSCAPSCIAAMCGSVISVRKAAHSAGAAYGRPAEAESRRTTVPRSMVIACQVA